MIDSSFIQLKGFGRQKEANLWRRGIINWRDFIDAKEIKGISKERKMEHDIELEHSSLALEERDASFFFFNFPSSESWRLFKTFKNEAVYLDIETSVYYGDITVIGLYDGEQSISFVKSYNLDRHNLKEALKDFKIIITFNGSCFDLPLIKRKFGDVFPRVPHIDLRFACNRLGLKGGLKNIEKMLNIQRDNKIKEVRGGDAVYLWEMFYSTRNKNYLEKLIEYNRADIVNLEPIADFCYSKLKEDLFKEIIKN